MKEMLFFYQKQGLYEEAEPLCKRLLTSKEKAFEAGHVEVLNTKVQMAHICANLGRYAEAECFSRQVLISTETELAELKSGDPKAEPILKAMHNLGCALLDQDRVKETQSVYEGRLAASERLYGLDHPTTQLARDGMVFIYEKQGLYDEAKAMRDRPPKDPKTTAESSATAEANIAPTEPASA